MKKKPKAKIPPKTAYIAIGSPYRKGAVSVSAVKVTLCGFFIPVEKFATLKNTCKKAFDTPSKGKIKCTPLDRLVVLLVDTTSWVGDKENGTFGFSQNEALFHVPVLIENSATGLASPAFFTPWIFVDNADSLIAGREIQGYPKTLGSILGLPPPIKAPALAAIPVPPALADPPKLTVDVYGAKTQKDLYLNNHTLLEITPAPGIVLAPTIEELLAAAGGLGLKGETLTLLSAWSDSSATNKYNQYFLKQFPDIANSNFACARQITAANYLITHVYSFQPFSKPFNLTINTLYTHDVRATLGIPAVAQVYGFQSVLDFTLENGRVIWP